MQCRNGVRMTQVASTGIGRVVFALSEAGMRDLLAANPTNDVLALSCREVFAVASALSRWLARAWRMKPAPFTPVFGCKRWWCSEIGRGNRQSCVE